MLIPAALLAVVAGAAPLKLATVGFSQVGLSDAQAQFYADHLSTKLAEDPSVRVTTPKDMAAVIGVEKQRELLGCSDQSTSCMAELAGALGADGLVTGQVAKVGKSYQLNVKIIAADGSKTLFVHSSKLLSSEEEVIEEMNTLAPQALRRVREVLAGGAAAAAASAPAAATEVSASSSSPSRWPKLLPVFAGVILAGVGVVECFVASDKYHQLHDTMNWPMLVSSGTALDVKNSGELSVTLGVTFLSVGVVAIAAGLLWYLLGGS
jgi:hypothetical protein